MGLLRIGSIVLLIVLLPTTVLAATFSIHAAVGDLAGQISTSERDAALLAFASHAVLDTTLRQQVVNWQNPKELRQNWSYLATDAVLTGLVIARAAQDRKRLLGIGFSLLPDIIDGLYSAVCRKCWMQGDLLFPWHDAKRVHLSVTATNVWSMSVVLATW